MNNQTLDFLLIAKLEILRSLRENSDRKTYGQKLKEAAQKLGKLERRVRRLVRTWQENGLAALAEVPRTSFGTNPTLCIVGLIRVKLRKSSLVKGL